MRTPLGVKLVAGYLAFFAAAGFLALLGLAVILTYIPSQLVSALALTSSLASLAVILTALAAYGLWNLRKWSYYLTLGILLFSIVESFLSSQGLSAFLDILILAYLYNSRRIFGAE